ncbi:TfoX/Sxy family protein [Shewanella hanedai]|uniref:TfoX/Sxy family protein n=1 Tax=Shewanella hanedai TaxID=25 RepID=A0A553JT59_SHEHA|nr:TfoX/Sxy family protein [Shewanella hanedai]
MVNVDKLPNLGPKSTAWLNNIGIYTRAELHAVGPITAMIRLERAGHTSSLNMLYALVGVLEGVHWQEIAHTRKGELVLALDAARELEKLNF